MRRREALFRSEGETLVGNLVLPDGEGPFPTMVFIAGTNPQNRHGDLLGDGVWNYHGAFRLIRDRLAEGEIASLC